MDKVAVLMLERSASVIDVAREGLGGDVDLHVTSSLDLALRFTARLKPAVAILDAMMCGAAPGETVTKLRAAHPGLRIVFIAEEGIPIDRRHAQLGTLLRKPFTAERFAEVVRGALRLQSMSAGVERMRHSSGTYPAVQANEPVEITTSRRISSFPPARARNLTPPPTPPREELPPRPRNLTPPPRSLTPAPIPREDLFSRPRSLTPAPIPREDTAVRTRNLMPPPIPREEIPPPRQRNLTPRPMTREELAARTLAPRDLTQAPIPREEPPTPPRTSSGRSAPPPPLRTEPLSETPPPHARSETPPPPRARIR